MASAVESPVDIMAPAWPIRFPAGAVRPASGRLADVEHRADAWFLQAATMLNSR